MLNKNLLRALRVKTQPAGITLALFILALTQIPLAIKTTAELACIGELSNQLWKETGSHKNVNPIAVQRCNGGTL